MLCSSKNNTFPKHKYHYFFRSNKSPNSSYKTDEMLIAPPISMLNNPYAGGSSNSNFGDFQLDRKLNKYKMFGNFISAALADLPSDDMANDIMQKITLEIFAVKRDCN